MNEPQHDEPKVWVLADDRAGNRAQAIGVAVALGRPYTVKDLAYESLAMLPNILLPPTFATLTPASRAALAAPWPDLVIAAGRRTAPVARRIKRLSGGQTRLVQVMSPGCAIADFDLVCIPSHDPMIDADNVREIVGAPHGVTPAALAEARSTWTPQLVDLPAPRIALIVGGTTRRRRFTDTLARDLASLASAMATAAGGSLLVTTSRRTGGATETLIRHLDAPARVYRWGDGGENPYLGFLASADAIVATGESISMCSEACAGEGPVYVYAPPALITPKHARFHQVLYDRGLARPLDGALASWRHAPLNAADDIAAAINRLGLV